MSAHEPDLARSFGSVAAAYDRGRPSYPLQAAAWVTADLPVSVLELGAGTGKLTEQLVALGHDVHATDPDPAMLELLQARLPDVRVSASPAEEIPAGDRSYDVVVCASSFHWFDHDRALPEIARVLRHGGRLSLIWNLRDESVPWVRRLGALIRNPTDMAGSEEALVASELFGEVEETSFRFRQTIDRESIQDMVLSRSHVATLPPAEQASKMAEVLAFYDEFGRGMDGMQLPYLTKCFRTRVLDLSLGTAASAAEVSDGSDTDMLLIDFH